MAGTPPRLEKYSPLGLLWHSGPGLAAEFGLAALGTFLGRTIDYCDGRRLASAWLEEMDFAFLFDRTRKLLRIGYAAARILLGYSAFLVCLRGEYRMAWSSFSALAMP